MKFSNPRGFGINNAVFISLFFSVIYSLYGWYSSNFDLISLILFTVLLFAFTFVISYYTVREFVYEKIKLIYKTILDLKAPSGTKKFKLSGDIIENVNKDVIEWEENQRKEIQQLKESAGYRREFMGNVSHELKTPIFNIQGYVLTLLDGGLEDPHINREYLLRTEKSINRMIAIVEDLESISQLEYGELNLNLQSFNLVDLARDVVDFLDMKAKKKENQIYFARNYERPIYVEGDKKKIRQIFINLIENAIKYGKKEGGKTKVSFFDMDESILVEVTDNGIGIPKESLNRLFERFYRTDKARSRDQGGTGLGLSIVKHIIEAHGQSINVRSTLGVGTTFAFTLKKGN